jgi:hypothetical protein
MNVLRRFLFWDYPRASWQYDVMVGAILIFIFAAPRYINFRDQPRAASVVMLPVEQGVQAYHIETSLLTGVPEGELAAKATELVRARYKTNVAIARVEPIRDSEDEIIGYAAFAR